MIQTLLPSGIVLIINIILFAFGYGKLTTKVEQLIKDNENIKINCSDNRNKCQTTIGSTNCEIFNKLDSLKDSMNENFLRLSIQVAKLERENNER